jgi:hypothetical protein
MTFEYVQTWMVREGYEEAHDELFKSWVLKIGDDPYLRSIRFPPSPMTLSRKRILVYCFNDAGDWRRFRTSTMGMFRVFVKQWRQFIDLNTYKVYFWEKGECLDKEK